MRLEHLLVPGKEHGRLEPMAGLGDTDQPRKAHLVSLENGSVIWGGMRAGGLAEGQLPYPSPIVMYLAPKFMEPN